METEITAGMQTSLQYVDIAKEYLIAHGGKVVLALLTLFVGFWVISKFSKTIRKIMTAKGVDAALTPFLLGLVNYTLKTLLVISVMTMVGIQMTSFIAVLGAMGLAIGMALSGTLQNFAGGIMLLVLRPFKKGDFIEAQGYSGFVDEIQIFNTIVKTVDNRIVYIPNGGLATSSMINYTREETRRVDVTFGIGYGDDIDKARAIILEVVAQNDTILTDPAPFVGVSELGDSSVNLASRVWVNVADYWDVFFYMNEMVKKAFDKEGISIPFPQRDVHIYNQK